jgi:hypothetical protein
VRKKQTSVSPGLHVARVVCAVLSITAIGCAEPPTESPRFPTETWSASPISSRKPKPKAAVTPKQPKPEEPRPEAKVVQHGDLQIVAPREAAGAAVEVDGTSQGAVASDGGLFISQIAEGTHEVELTLAGYEPQHGTVSVVAHRTTILNVEKPDPETKHVTDPSVELRMGRIVGGLHIRAAPAFPAVQVSVGEADVGKAPVTIAPLAVGRTQVKRVRSGFGMSCTVDVVQGKLRVLRADLASKTCVVEIDEPLVTLP